MVIVMTVSLVDELPDVPGVRERWGCDVVHTAPALTDEQTEQLAARDIRVVAGIVKSLEVVDDRLTGVHLRDGTVVARQALGSSRPARPLLHSGRDRRRPSPRRLADHRRRGARTSDVRPRRPTGHDSRRGHAIRRE
jgi:hypothetical protein